MKKNRYFIYVRMANIFRTESDPEYRIVVYDYIGDIFHAIGEIMYRTEIEINRITFTEWNEKREKFWNDKGVKIRKWFDKYEAGGIDNDRKM